MLSHRMTRTAVAGALAVAGLIGVVGCTSQSSTAPVRGGSPTAASPAATEQVAPGDIPDTQAFVTATAPSGGWSIKVPEGWAQQQVTTGVRFTDKLNTIEAVERPAAQAPTVTSVRSTEIPALTSADPGVQVGSVSTFTRAGGSGVLVRYQLDSAKDSVTGKVHRDAAEEYVFFKGGREVVVTVSGAVGADNVDPWRIVTNSFRWLR
jgi:hypothetical protein